MSRHYNGALEVDDASWTDWHDAQLSVVTANGTQAGTPSIGMVLTGALSGATLTIVHLGTTYAAGSVTGAPLEGENMRNGANGFDACVFTANAFFYPTVRGNPTSPAIFRRSVQHPGLPAKHVSAERATNVLMEVPLASVLSLSTDLKLLRVNVKLNEDNLTQQASASADLTLTAAEQDIVGATLTLAEIGTYLVWGVFDLSNIGDPGETLIGVLSVAGASQSQLAALRGIGTSFSPGTGDSSFSLDTNVRATVAQAWRVTTTAVNTIVKLRAYKTGGAGTSIAANPNTRVTAYRQTSTPLAWAPAGITVHASLFGEHA